MTSPSGAASRPPALPPTSCLNRTFACCSTHRLYREVLRREVALRGRQLALCAVEREGIWKGRDVQDDAAPPTPGLKGRAVGCKGMGWGGVGWEGGGQRQQRKACLIEVSM
jgi:hypothetical protein